MIGELRGVPTVVNNMQSVVTSGFDSLKSLTRGDSYLLDDDSELSIADDASGAVGG